MADPQPCGPAAREVNSLFGSPPRPGRSSGKSPGGCPDERLDGRLELTLGRAQLLTARGAGECSRGLEGGVGEVHQLWVPADKLYAEPGGFRCGTQAVAFDAGLSGFLPARVRLRTEPKGDESSLQLGDGRREASAGVRLLLSATLVALERLRPLSRAILEQISRERPRSAPATPIRPVSTASIPAVHHTPSCYASASHIAIEFTRVARAPKTEPTHAYRPFSIEWTGLHPERGGRRGKPSTLRRRHACTRYPVMGLAMTGEGGCDEEPR